jgi:proteic killer suppression protein
MIRSFKCADTESLAKGFRVKRFVNIEAVARRKLRQLEIAARLEALKGRRAHRYSIRINDQWRICFRWTVVGAEDVEIIDYH